MNYRGKNANTNGILKNSQFFTLSHFPKWSCSVEYLGTKGVSRFFGWVRFRLFSWSRADSKRAEHLSPAMGALVSGGSPPGPMGAGLPSKRFTSNRGRNLDSATKVKLDEISMDTILI